MADLEQSEDGVCPVVEVPVDRRVVAVGRKHILRQVIGAEAEEVGMSRDLARREGRSRGLDHGSY